MKHKKMIRAITVILSLFFAVSLAQAEEDFQEVYWTISGKAATITKFNIYTDTKINIDTEQQEQVQVIQQIGHLKAKGSKIVTTDGVETKVRLECGLLGTIDYIDLSPGETYGETQLHHIISCPGYGTISTQGDIANPTSLPYEKDGKYWVDVLYESLNIIDGTGEFENFHGDGTVSGTIETDVNGQPKIDGENYFTIEATFGR